MPYSSYRRGHALSACGRIYGPEQVNSSALRYKIKEPIIMNTQRIDRIIGIKEKVMEDKQREIEGTVAAIENTNNAVSDNEADARNTYLEMTSATMRGNDFSVVRDYLAYLDVRKAELLKEKEEWLSILADQRAALVELAKEVKTLEALRSKMMQAIKIAQNRKEQKMLDEIALRKKSD